MIGRGEEYSALRPPPPPLSPSPARPPAEGFSRSSSTHSGLSCISFSRRLRSSSGFRTGGEGPGDSRERERERARVVGEPCRDASAVMAAVRHLLLNMSRMVLLNMYSMNTDRKLRCSFLSAAGSLSCLKGAIRFAAAASVRRVRLPSDLHRTPSLRRPATVRSRSGDSRSRSRKWYAAA
eukprot:306908-Prorocentrum_minimum.AAC.1